MYLIHTERSLWLTGLNFILEAKFGKYPNLSDLSIAVETTDENLLDQKKGVRIFLLFLVLMLLREKCPNTDFLFRIFPHTDWIRKDTKYLSVLGPGGGKCGTEKILYLDTCSVCSIHNRFFYLQI